MSLEPPSDPAPVSCVLIECCHQLLPGHACQSCLHHGQPAMPVCCPTSMCASSMCENTMTWSLSSHPSYGSLPGWDCRCCSSSPSPPSNVPLSISVPFICCCAECVKTTMVSVWHTHNVEIPASPLNRSLVLLCCEKHPTGSKLSMGHEIP